MKQIEKMEIIEVEEEDTSKMRFTFPEPPRASRTIFETKSLSKKYENKLVLNNIDFSLERAKKYVLSVKMGR